MSSVPLAGGQCRHGAFELRFAVGRQRARHQRPVADDRNLGAGELAELLREAPIEARREVQRADRRCRR